MKVLFNGDNWDEIDNSDVFLPRPIRKELLEELLTRAKRVYMPVSTFQRISKRLREKYRHKIEIMSMRGRFGRYDPEVIAKVAALRKAGLSIRKIAEEVGIPKSTVHYVLTRLRKIDVGEKIIL